MLAALTIWRVILVSGRIDGDDVDDLEPRLPGRLDRLLAGDHHHRHGAEMRVGRTGQKLSAPGPSVEMHTPGARSAGHGSPP